MINSSVIGQPARVAFRLGVTLNEPSRSIQSPTAIILLRDIRMGEREPSTDLERFPISTPNKSRLDSNRAISQPSKRGMGAGGKLARMEIPANTILKGMKGRNITAYA